MGAVAPIGARVGQPERAEYGMAQQRRTAIPAPATLPLRGSGASSLAQILAERAVFPLFQPIVDLTTRKIVGVEALARGPAGSALEFPDALFGAAVAAGRLAELDQLCCARGLELARDAGPVVPPLVFVNAEPAALNAALTPELLEIIRSDLPFRIVLEFTERALSAAPATLLDIAEGVHGHGNAVALDDVGADPLSLAFLPMVEPEVVKLDMHLLRAPHDPGTLATAATVSAFAERTGATVLAEGVETEQDAAYALALGARWGQGWLFGRPGPLAAIAGRPVDQAARLRPPQRELHRPAGTPFGLAATRNAVRRGDLRMVDAVADQVFAQAAGSGAHAVVLCAPNGPGRPADWLPHLEKLAGNAAYVGLVAGRPAHCPPAVHSRMLGSADPLHGETTLVIIDPRVSVALTMRGTGDEVDFVLTHDRDLVQCIARMIMQRLPRTGSP